MEKPALLDEPFRRRFLVQKAAARRHPLRVAIGDGSAAAVGVGVVEDAVDDVGHRLEAPMRVATVCPWARPAIVHLAHLVHHDERIEILGLIVASAPLTGNPSPSKPVGAVATVRTLRSCTAAMGSGSRGG